MTGSVLPPPDEIRRLLFDAVAAGDASRLEALCHEHRDVILAHNTDWLEVPDAFRSNPEAYAWYHGLGTASAGSFRVVASSGGTTARSV